MNRHLLTLRAAFAALLSLASTIAVAGNVEHFEAGPNIRGFLDREAKYHLQALQKALQQPEYANFVRNNDYMDVLRTRTIKSTVTRTTYKYKDQFMNERVLVYRAKSGKSIETTLREIVNPPPPPEGRYSSDSERIRLREEEIARDRAEQKFYSHSPGEFRVTLQTPRKGGVKPTIATHTNDAELKTLRQLESDLKNGAVPKGGELEIYVSQDVCSSCMEAIEQFSTTHDLRRTSVYSLQDSRGVSKSKWRISQAESHQFFRNRTTMTNTALATGNVRRGTFRSEREALSYLEKVEAEEAGKGAGLESACEP